MQAWFTSDWHLAHVNIIKYTKRPFKSVEQMNQTIIRNFNRLVKSDDYVYYLGDFCFGRDNAQYFLNQLNGQWTFIMGGHDYQYKLKSIFKEYCRIGYNNELAIYDLKNIQWPPEVKKGEKQQQITLCHYPLVSWSASCHGSWHLYGHVHKHTVSLEGKRMNVSIDVTKFRPVSFDEVKRYMNKREENLG